MGHITKLVNTRIFMFSHKRINGISEKNLTICGIVKGLEYGLNLMITRIFYVHYVI